MSGYGSVFGGLAAQALDLVQTQRRERHEQEDWAIRQQRARAFMSNGLFRDQPDLPPVSPVEPFGSINVFLPPVSLRDPLEYLGVPLVSLPSPVVPKEDPEAKLKRTLAESQAKLRAQMAENERKLKG